MHPPDAKAAALALLDEGLNDCEVSRRTGIPRTTIRDWRRPRYAKRRQTEICPRCWQPAKPIRFRVDDYSELLAIYLGDGCISAAARTSRLRIALDLKYPGIIEDGRALLERLFPGNDVDIVPFKQGHYVNLSLYNRHLPCLLPQHGVGRKHEQRIALEEWQLAILIAAPWPFIRGCIRTDGCVFMNRTGRYEYLSYHFSNMSRDIANLLAFALQISGVDYRLTSGGRTGVNQLRINRRASVRLCWSTWGSRSDRARYF